MSKYYKRTLVRRSATIGANATILCGITIGKYAFVAAGSVVTKSVPNYSLIIGNPGKIVGWVDERGKKIKFKSNGESICGNFRLTNNIVVESL